MSELNLIGETNYRNQNRRFGIKPDDRRRHFYVIGKTGMGKTELLKTMIIQDIQAGKGVGFVDPHGEAAEEILDYIPKERIGDVCYFNPADLNYPISFNVMEKVDIEHRHLVASGLMEVFKKIWPDVWSARMEYILHNSILALLEYPGSTLLGVNRMLADPEYRADVVDKIKDPVVKSYWIQEYARYTQRYEVEATAAIQNKIGQFISSPLIRNIIGQVGSSVDMRKIMDEEKILILNLSKGRIGEESSKLLGGLLITKLQLAAMSRVDIPEPQRKDFFLYVDEFQNFATSSFVNILSEARKYRLNLILAHQYINQMEETVRDAVFGNIGTMATFRVGAEDAEFLEKELFPEFTAKDLVDLPKRQIYLKLIVDGVAGRPFSAKTMDSFPRPKESYKDKIISLSREKFTSTRQSVEQDIATWTGNFVIKENQTQVAEPVMHEVKCQECDKWTRVPFKPEKGKPVYCKACLKKITTERMGRNSLPAEKKVVADSPKTMSLEELLLKDPVSFSHRNVYNGKKDKKEIDRSELKKVIRESLESKEEDVDRVDSIRKTEFGSISGLRNRTDSLISESKGNEPKIKKINPGEIIKF